MRSHLFIHASLAVKNKHDLPSKILSKINDTSIFEMMLKKMRRLNFIDKIVIVTSCLDCDSKIIEITEKIIENNDKFNLIKLEQGKEFSFDEKNKILEPNFLYKVPSYGFYNSELLKNYFNANGLDSAVLLNADETPCIEPELIDRIILDYNKQGCFYGTRYPGESLLVVPAESLSKINVCKYNLDQKFEDGINNIDDEIQQIRNFNPQININQITAKKKSFLTNKFKRPVNVFDVLYLFDVKKVIAKNAEKYQFYPVYFEKDVYFLETIFKKLKTLSLDEHDNVSQTLKNNVNKLVPSTLEIELTNRCNLKCDDCPHSILKREECDIRKEIFTTVIDSFSNSVQYLVFSGFGEPALHPDLFELIHLAKEKNILSVCLETNSTLLDKPFINALIDNKLDILTINIDALNSFYSDDLFMVESVIDMVDDIKKERKTEKPYLVIQTINRMSNQNRVQYYYKRWDNIADSVLIQPFNDYCDAYDRSEQINLAPLTPIQECSKTSQSQLVFADGSLTLCKQKFNGFAPSEKQGLNEIWIDNYYRGNYYNFCKKCIMKYYRECVQPDRFHSSFQFKIDSDIISKHINKAINQSENLSNEKNIGKTLSIFEKVLKFYPDNPVIHEKLENIEKQL